VSSSQKTLLAAISFVIAVAIAFPLFNQHAFSGAAGWLTYVGAVSAILSYLGREFLAMRSSRKQHTVTVLLQSRLSTAFNDRAKAFLRGYPVMPSLTMVKVGDWDDPAKHEALEGLKYLLNYYEFIAIGVRTGDLDEEYLKLSLKSIVRNLCSVADAFIQKGQTRDHEVYKNLLWLRDRWIPKAPGDGVCRADKLNS
jgi:hypothetical protein